VAGQAAGLLYVSTGEPERSIIKFDPILILPELNSLKDIAREKFKPAILSPEKPSQCIQFASDDDDKDEAGQSRHKNPTRRKFILLFFCDKKIVRVMFAK
jgi:hypothetical protein